jgi:hypothetical protein
MFFIPNPLLNQIEILRQIIAPGIDQGNYLQATNFAHEKTPSPL